MQASLYIWINIKLFKQKQMRFSPYFVGTLQFFQIVDYKCQHQCCEKYNFPTHKFYYHNFPTKVHKFYTYKNATKCECNTDAKPLLSTGNFLLSTSYFPFLTS